MRNDRTGRRQEGRPKSALSDAEQDRLLHDLSVHQVELQTQNEELQRIREDLEVALANYTELFDFAPIGYLTLGTDGRIREANHAAARILGRTRPALEGCPIEEPIRFRDRPRVGQLVSRALSSNEREDGEFELANAGGRRVYVHLTAILLAPRGPKLLVTVQDITARKEREEKLEATERALRVADHRKDEFLAALSHELRNPLAPIRTSLYVLQRTDPGSPTARRAQVTIDRQVTHLARLVDDLLDVTRIARGKVLLQKERLELGELVRKTVEDHRATFDAAQVALEARTDPGRFWVDVDPARILQSLSNVLGNALKFTPAGGRVVVRVRPRDAGHVEVSVEDTGMGIDPEVLPHLFEPFAQGPQPIDRSRGGLGLGLAMVKGLVELHGGTVSLESGGLHRGSMLRLVLPIVEAPGERADELGTRDPTRPRRVLVIEDNMDAADTLKEALELNGHVVAVAYDGMSGLAQARTFRPEIVICDLGLPVMDGYAVARAFRATEGTPYLVALSGYAQPEDLERAKTAGFDRHIAKPPSLDVLDRLLDEAPSQGESTAPMLH